MRKLTFIWATKPSQEPDDMMMWQNKVAPYYCVHYLLNVLSVTFIFVWLFHVFQVLCATLTCKHDVFVKCNEATYVFNLVHLA